MGAGWRWREPRATLRPMKPYRLFLLALACSWALGAHAQWQWLDKDGRKVFSDRPPPHDVPEKSILKRPGQAAAPAAPSADAADSAAAPATAARPAASVPRASGVDKELEEKKQQAEAAEAAKKKAEEERMARQRADNCRRARQSKATFDSGIRVATTNAKGEREILDDNARAAEGKRLDGIIASDCR